MKIEEFKDVDEKHGKLYRYVKGKWILIGIRCYICSKYFQHTLTFLKHIKKHEDDTDNK